MNFLFGIESSVIEIGFIEENQEIADDDEDYENNENGGEEKEEENGTFTVKGESVTNPLHGMRK